MSVKLELPSAAQMDKLMSLVTEFITSDKVLMQKAFEFREKLSAVSQYLAEQANPYKAPAFIQSLTKKYLQLGSGFPGLGLSAGFAFSMMSGVGAALPPDLAIVNGNNGGPDQCSALNACIQNALVNTTSNEVLAVFGSNVVVTGTGGNTLSALAQVETCFTHDVLAKVVEQVFNAVGSVQALIGGIECSSTSSTWQGTEVTGSTSGISPAACYAFQNSENSAANTCQQWDNSVTANLIGWGAWAAIIASVCICCACCSYFGHRHVKNRYYNNNNNDDLPRFVPGMEAASLQTVAVVPTTAATLDTSGERPEGWQPDIQGYGSGMRP